MERLEEVKILIEKISPKEDDIIIVKFDSEHVQKKILADLRLFFKKIKRFAILSTYNGIKDVVIASDKELANIGLMRIPKETNGKA